MNSRHILARTLLLMVVVATVCGGGGANGAGNTPAGCSPSGALPAALLSCRAWITFEPPRPFDPTRGIFPSEAELRASLQAMVAEGWRGIVTYSLEDSLAQIPRIAKEVGFTHVIAGLFWTDLPHLMVEKAAALREAAFIDAYVLGNEGLNTRYTRTDLEREIAGLKSDTGRPVATSESINRYEDDATLATVGDWVFANVQPYVGGIRSIPLAVQDSVAKFEALQRQAPGRVVVAKEVWWPTCGGDSAATEVNQTEFFRQLSVTPVKFLWGEYADQFWKTGEGPQGPCWGLHTDRGVPKQVIQVLQPVYTSTYTPVMANYEGLWWNSPAGSESGWGINFAQQGDTIFATWFTYDLTGKGMWLVMATKKKVNGVYTGTLYQLTGGPAFDAVPFPSVGRPGGAVDAVVGAGTLTFTDADNGSFAYTVNGNSQTKAITREIFGPLPTCIFVAQPDLTLATNYQNLWWAVPPGSEAGWGVNLTHQGDKILAAWFTYDHDHTPMWLVAVAPKIAPGTYSGTLLRATGPPFNAVPFPPTGSPGGAIGTNVGTATFTFADGNNASFAYTVQLAGMPSPVTQTKMITREIFDAPGTVCQ